MLRHIDLERARARVGPGDVLGRGRGRDARLKLQSVPAQSLPGRRVPRQLTPPAGLVSSVWECLRCRLRNGRRRRRRELPGDRADTGVVIHLCSSAPRHQNIALTEQDVIAQSAIQGRMARAAQERVDIRQSAR